MARIENKNAPMKTEIDVRAPRSPTINATARGLVDAEAEYRALTRVDRANTETVRMLMARVVRMDLTASCEMVKGNSSGAHRAR